MAPSMYISPRYFDNCPSLELKKFFRETPWPHLVLDNFLTADIFEKAADEVLSYSYDFECSERGTSRIEYSLLQSVTLWNVFYSAEFIALLQSAFDHRITLDRRNLIQLRRMTESTPEFPLHNDYREGTDHLVSFLYLSDDWAESKGGRLVMYDSELSSATPVYLEPFANRLLVFRTASTHWHKVEQTVGWTRLSILAAWSIN